MNYKDGKVAGLVEWYYENGQLERRGKSIDGKKDGPYKRYFKNGQLQIRSNYKDGKREGLWEYLDERGERTRGFGCFKNDKEVDSEGENSGDKKGIDS